MINIVNFIIKIYTDSFEANFIMNSIEAINKNINASSISTTSVYIYLNFLKPCLINSIHITIKNATSSDNIATSSHIMNLLIDYINYIFNIFSSRFLHITTIRTTWSINRFCTHFFKSTYFYFTIFNTLNT